MPVGRQIAPHQSQTAAQDTLAKGFDHIPALRVLEAWHRCLRVTTKFAQRCEVFDLFTHAANLLASAQIPANIAAALAVSRLTALRKPAGGARVGVWTGNPPPAQLNEGARTPGC